MMFTQQYKTGYIHYSDGRSGPPPHYNARETYAWQIEDKHGTEASEHAAKLAITRAIANAPKATYKLISLDVWGNAKDGFQVNDLHYTGATITVSSLATDADIIRALKDLPEQYLYKHIRHSLLEIDGEPEYTLYLSYKPTSEPLFQLEREQ